MSNPESTRPRILFGFENFTGNYLCADCVGMYAAEATGCTGWYGGVMTVWEDWAELVGIPEDVAPESVDPALLPRPVFADFTGELSSGRTLCADCGDPLLPFKA